MAQQNTCALEVRTGKDKGGLGQNRQGKAYSGQNARRTRYSPANARGQGKPMEAQANGRMGKAGITWEMRCADLGHAQWIRYSGPADQWAAVRNWANALDHDEARPIGWGKTVTIEARELGSSKIVKFEVSGEIQYRYHVKELG